jgi:hypothetical protein
MIGEHAEGCICWRLDMCIACCTIGLALRRRDDTHLQCIVSRDNLRINRSRHGLAEMDVL